ncbi:uncharacterized protein BX663DRAFT_500055 [Cokeromyces recurvatus]|uniref:uncharacterized protein n=1 Tax=Cokeromyces recurvatus TaxID=90255 RepID=UPI002220BDA9|nr:uncharacterized protein BX663DRAFT_500055 [Cokeromyces recurvatus]KAI7905532.1 hypothetical protein BX663DRAFT_500055 [Cokeromyces recurvatus]
MAFRFNFTNEELDIEDTEENQQLESSLHDLSIDEEQLNKIPSQEYDILSSPLPSVIQADIINIPNVNIPLYKRTLADVQFQMAQQDQIIENQDDNTEKEVLDMLNLTGNTDLIRGVYEGGFKTWECSVDLVQFLSSLSEDQITHKRVLELGCGSSLPSLFLLSHSQTNRVDVQDYNSQVIRYITIPNILLNTVLSVQEPTINNEEMEEEDDDEDDNENNVEEEEEEDKRIEEDPITCDAEAEIQPEKIPTMLKQVHSRTRAFVGDWSSLPDQLNVDQEKYDMIVTSETIYAEHALPDLIQVIQKALKKPNGIW